MLYVSHILAPEDTHGIAVGGSERKVQESRRRQ